jgi:hypothetical protein
MSQEQVLALREELTALSTDVAGIVALGAREGFTFSAADVAAVIQSKRAEAGQPLSEEELEQVAGGTVPPIEFPHGGWEW